MKTVQVTLTVEVPDDWADASARNKVMDWIDTASETTYERLLDAMMPNHGFPSNEARLAAIAIYREDIAVMKVSRSTVRVI